MPQLIRDNLKVVLEFVVLLVLICLAYMALLRIDIKQANYAIAENMVGYFNALNKQEYDKMQRYLYPTDSKEYLLNMMIKAKAVGVTSVRLQSVYPALVDGNLAIVGFETSTNAVFQGQDLTARQTDTFFFRRKSGKWYIAKPEDLIDIPAQKISDMIDAYKPIMKENMAGSIVEQRQYNIASLQKLRETAK